MEGDKNSISNIYKDIRQSRLCSARLEASTGPTTKGVPNNNQRGRGSGPCLLWGGLDKSRHIVPIAWLVRVQCFRKDLYMYKVVEGQSTRSVHVQGCRRAKYKTYGPLDDQWVILSTSKAFDNFRARWDEIRFTSDPP